MSEDRYAVNPYDPLSEERLVAFEAEVGRRLPEQYRRWLLQTNGQSLRANLCNFAPNEPWSGWVSVHHVRGLHDGPVYSRLQRRWRLWKYYDLDAWKWRLRRFLAFADTGNGDVFALHLKTGAVWIYLHDDIGRPFSLMPGRLCKISDSFDDWLNGLLTREQWHDRLKGTPEYEAFLLQKEQIVKNRAAYVVAKKPEQPE